MFRPLSFVLERIIKTGHLSLIDAGGRPHDFGDKNAKAVTVRLTDAWTERLIAFNPALAIGEAYMDGRLVVEQGTIYDFLEVLLADLDYPNWPWLAKMFECARFATRWLQQFNPVPRAKRNVAHHYDLDGSLYDLFLDRDRQYSCAYFDRDGASLDEAQAAKKRHLAAKLDLRDGQKVLDIGSGWGGLALYLAKTAQVEVTGVTLSAEQLALSRERARAAGLAHVVQFELCDYRDLVGQFDRIVSVGMFEHVGVSQYRTFFECVRKLLKKDGVALLHSIGRFDGPWATNPFIAKYIFPGGYIPALSEVFPVVERTGLLVNDVEILRLHYAMTLRHWRQRFRASWHAAVERWGERFCRMWEFYLAGAETGFRYQNLMVFQMQLTRELHVLPLTRDYVYRTEGELRERDLGTSHGGARRSKTPAPGE